VRVAAEGAKVGHADLEETTNALTATIASGMLPATETYAQAMGQLNTIVGSGDMKMSDLNEALGTGAAGHHEAVRRDAQRRRRGAGGLR
jgi:hypothetical protein